MNLPQGNNRIAAMLVGVVVTMGALAWAAVPFYSWFCRVTGYGGTPSVRTEAAAEVLDEHVLQELEVALRVHGGQRLDAEIIRLDVLETCLCCRSKQALGALGHLGIGVQRARGNEDLRSVRELRIGKHDFHDDDPSRSNGSPSIS